MMQGGSEGVASRGIGHRHVGGLDGEVTGQGVVGAALPALGVYDVRCQGLGAGEARSAREAERWGRGLHWGRRQ
jgi:hypothetical protein